MSPAVAQTITYSNGQTQTSPIVLTLPGDTLDVTTGTATQAGNISGNGSITKTGAGTLNLTGNNVYSGGTNLDGGTLEIDHTTALGISNVQIDNSDTELLVNANGTIANTVGIADTIDTTLAAAHGTNVTFSDVMFGAATIHFGSNGNDGTIMLIAGGTLGAMTISVDAGVLRPFNGFTSAITGAPGNSLNVGAAGTYDLNAIGATTARLTGTGHITNNGATAATLITNSSISNFDGVIQDGTSTTALHLTNASHLGLGGVNTYTGGTIIDTGSILIGNATSIQGQILNNGAIDFTQNANGTFSGDISGTGDLVKNGVGTLNLTGNNTYSGGTNLDDGTLQIGQTTVLGIGNIQISNSGTELLVDTNGALTNTVGMLSNIDTTLAAAHGTNVTFGDVVFGASTVHFGSTGNDGIITLIAGATLGTLAISVDDGILRPSNGFTSTITGTLGDSLNIGTAGTYDLNGIDTTTARLTGNGHVTNNGGSAATLVTSSSISNFDGDIGDGNSTTALHLTNASHLGLYGTNTYTGGTIIDIGSTLNGNTASLQGQILNNGGIDFAQNTNGTYAGDISGTGSFVKNGTASLNLTGNNTYGGATNVFNGRLAVNGALPNSIVTIASGGTLGGNGTVAGIIANSGGIIGPGNSIGTLHVAGNVGFNVGSIYQVEVTGAGQSDQILATGTATINGGTVQVLAQGGFYGGTTDYTILNAAGGVTGTFAGVTSNYAFLTPTLSYDNNNVYLDLASNGLVFQSVAATPNQLATAGGAESLGVGNPVYDTIQGLTAADAQAAYDSLSGEVHASTANTLLSNAHYLSDAMIGRLRQSDIESDNTAAHQLAALDTPASDILAIDTAAGPTASHAVWGQAFGGWRETDGAKNTARLDNTTSGFVMGVDGQIATDWRLGIAAAYSHSDEDLAARNSSAAIDSYHIATYGGGHVGPVALRAGGSYSFNRIASSRDVGVGSINDHDKASYSARTAQVFGEIGYDARIGPVALEPFAGMTYVNLQTDSFTEKGGTTALHGRSSNQDLPYSTLGLRAAGEIAQFDGATLTARGALGWRHAFGDVTPTTSLTFASGSDAFTVTGTPISRNALVVQAGLDLAVTDRLAISLNYDGQLATDARDNAVQAQAKFTF
jgi:outer membrane autotransporter protein